MDHEELRYWLRLECTEGVGNTTARHLLTAFGLPQSLFSQTESALREVVTERQAKALSRIPEGLALALETTWEWLQADSDEGLRNTSSSWIKSHGLHDNEL